MWSEVLKVKPEIDAASGRRMERSLSGRFATVSKKFGGGLKSILKGAVFGISVGLLNRLLNPLDEVGNRIKSLLGQGKDIRDLADRFGTTPGQLKDIQDFSASIGVDPEKLADLMSKYADAIDTAREEIANPNVPFSETTKGLQNFAGEKDLAKSFLNFLATQRAESATEAGRKNSENIQRELFGSVLKGSEKKLISTDFAGQVGLLGSSTGAQGAALDKLAGLSDQKSLLETIRLRRELLKASGAITPGTVLASEVGAGKEQSLLDERLAGYKAMQDAASGITAVKSVLGDLTDQATKGVGFLGNMIDYIKGSYQRGFRPPPGKEAKGKGKGAE